MKIADILILENKYPNAIILHKEGLFWRAYEKSAFLFTQNIKAFKLTKKYIKNVKTNIVYLGFPENSLVKILEYIGKKEIIKQEKYFVISKYEINKNNFTDWKNSIDITITKTLSSTTISEKIRNYPIIAKTPIECQQFLIELQTEINGTI